MTWDTGFEREPAVRFNDDGSVQIDNVRNFRYECDGTHEPGWERRTFDLNAVCHVDFIVVPFAGHSGLAHTMVSFGFDDGRYLAISVEARRQAEQPYSIVKGLFGAFQLMYVIADERDVIGHRSEYRGDTVHLYRSAADREESTCFLRSMLERAEQLRVQPEKYNTLTNNCLTNLRDHVNRIWPKRIPWNWRVVLTGHASHLAYHLRLLKESDSFQSLVQQAAINDLAKGQWHQDDFSRVIRGRLDEYCPSASEINTERTVT